MASLFRVTEGGKWKDNAGWRDLAKLKRVLSSAALAPSGAASSRAAASDYNAQQASHKSALLALFGVKCDASTGEVQRVLLPSNGLRGE